MAGAHPQQACSGTGRDAGHCLYYSFGDACTGWEICAVCKTRGSQKLSYNELAFGSQPAHSLVLSYKDICERDLKVGNITPATASSCISARTQNTTYYKEVLWQNMLFCEEHVECVYNVLIQNIAKCCLLSFAGKTKNMH